MLTRFLVCFLSAVVVNFRVACAQASDDALAYLTTINTEYDQIGQDMMSYMSAVNHGKSARKIDKRRGELVTQVKLSERNIRLMKPFKGETSLRDSIASYLQISYIILTEDYGKIVDLEDIAEQSYDAMEAYMLAKEKAGEKVDASNLAASRQFKAFASSNNIRLVESTTRLDQRLKAVAKVNDYSTKVYLLFFKSYKNEAYLLDAVNRGDIAAMEQSRNALASSATDDLVKLRDLQAFEGDGSLRSACHQILAFYKTEAIDKVPVVIDFYVKKETHEKMRKAIESKSPSDRTKAEIDTFNRAIGDYNGLVNKSNGVNQELNKKRSSLLKAWNQAYEGFLDSHTP